MSNSPKQAVITLIEKQGKDRTLIDKWRPISLANVDAKIISKVIASRINFFLPYPALTAITLVTSKIAACILVRQ